jgi:hypothetical protein
MSTLSAKDRVSLCSFTFADGRRCRTPRASNHPHFCFYHAQKEARAQAAETLGKDLAYFFSGNYLSACDLSTALARLIPAVLRGDVKPKTAHTVAYLMQTLMQAIHMSQHEYCEAFGSNAWRKSIFNSVKGNHDYRFPPEPEPQQSGSPQPQPQPAQPPAQAQQPAPSPRTPMPPTSAEFAQQVLAGRNRSQPTCADLVGSIPIPSRPSPQTGEKSSPSLTPLEATLTKPPVTVDSKPLT